MVGWINRSMDKRRRGHPEAIPFSGFLHFLYHGIVIVVFHRTLSTLIFFILCLHQQHFSLYHYLYTIIPFYSNFAALALSSFPGFCFLTLPSLNTCSLQSKAHSLPLVLCLLLSYIATQQQGWRPRIKKTVVVCVICRPSAA